MLPLNSSYPEMEHALLLVRRAPACVGSYNPVFCDPNHYCIPPIYADLGSDFEIVRVVFALYHNLHRFSATVIGKLHMRWNEAEFDGNVFKSTKIAPWLG